MPSSVVYKQFSGVPDQGENSYFSTEGKRQEGERRREARARGRKKERGKRREKERGKREKETWKSEFKFTSELFINLSLCTKYTPKLDR